jgi:hypothetical protein
MWQPRERGEMERSKPRPMTAADVENRWKDAAFALTLEQRQDFLNLMWGGATVNEARLQLGISFDAAMGIMNLNIKHHEVYTMNREAI